MGSLLHYAQLFYIVYILLIILLDLVLQPLAEQNLARPVCSAKCLTRLASQNSLGIVSSKLKRDQRSNI